MEVISNTMTLCKKKVAVRNEISFDIADYSRACFPFTVTLDQVLRKDGTIGRALERFEIFFKDDYVESRMYSVIRQPNYRHAKNLTRPEQCLLLHLEHSTRDQQAGFIRVASHQVINATIVPEAKNGSPTKHVILKTGIEPLVCMTRGGSGEYILSSFSGFEPNIRSMKGILKLHVEIVFEYHVTVVTPNSKNVGCTRNTDDLLTGLLSSLQVAKDIPELQDFTLICEGKSFPCSKFMLMAHSDVFKAMLSRSDTKESESNEVVIKDCAPDALEIFLQLLYTGQGQLQQNCLSDLFYLADKYQVLSIRQVVAKRLAETVNQDNACQVAILAHLHQEEEVLEAALQTMKSNLHVIKTMPGWSEIENKHPGIMSKLVHLELDSLKGAINNDVARMADYDTCKG